VGDRGIGERGVEDSGEGVERGVGEKGGEVAPGLGEAGPGERLTAGSSPRCTEVTSRLAAWQESRNSERAIKKGRIRRIMLIIMAGFKRGRKDEKKYRFLVCEKLYLPVTVFYSTACGAAGRHRWYTRKSD
jgi:hypothetical protein